MNATTTDPATADTAVDEPASQPLRAFLPVSGNRPVIVMLDLLDLPVVVMRTTVDGSIEVLPPSGPTLMLSGDYTVTPVTDPALRADCLARAVTRLRDDNQSQATQLHQARIDLVNARRDHTIVLAEIRAYAIRRHQDGDICRDGLNEFLTEFDLDKYQPRVRIRYTISGSYEVDGSDPDTATRDAEGYIEVNLSRVDNVVDDSSTVDVEVTDADTVED